MTGRGRVSAVWLAGWLFADLFVVVFLVALASLPEEVVARPDPSPSPSASPSAGPGADCPVSYDLTVKNFVITGVSLTGLLRGDARAERRLLSELDRQVREQGLTDSYAGLVLVFGVAPNSQRNTARRAALKAGNTIKAKREKFRRVTVRQFAYEARTTDELRVDTYFYVRC